MWDSFCHIRQILFSLTVSKEILYGLQRINQAQVFKLVII